MKSVIISAMAFLAALVAHNAHADVSYGSAVGDIFYTEANTKQGRWPLGLRSHQRRL